MSRVSREGFIRNLWRWSAGVPESGDPEPKRYDVEELRRTEWSREFERGMRLRLIMGAYRYGRINSPGKAKYDRLSSIIKRAAKYITTGDVDLLFDIANLALLEYEEGAHPKRHLDGAAHDETVRKVA